ncbi:hypothetical protein LIER_40565 [Lithospermum erythrorhizon]|uniref:NAC domain-containing protein n=1 Tax=Lithospermum erythrorhizon TaxID=34254 RepID=A0AAV3QWL6_LITER
MEIEGLRIPIGFIFKPTDKELVVHYLMRKIYSVPLPASVIPEEQVFDRNPWDLPGDLKERRYFFSKRYENGKNSSRIVLAGCGYWKAIGQDKPIVVFLSQNHHQIVGMKRTSFFFQRKRSQRIKNWWVMHQFFLVDSIANLSSNQNFVVQTGDWVVCSIYQHKKRLARKKGGKKQESNRQRTFEKNMRGLITNCNNNMDSIMIIEEDSSHSCSSGVTQILTSHDLEIAQQDQEATSRGC